MLLMDSKLAYELTQHDVAERVELARRMAIARQVRRRSGARVRMAGWLHRLAYRLEPAPRPPSPSSAAATAR